LLDVEGTTPATTTAPAHDLRRHFTITGGTGQYEGASGSGDITATSENGEFTADLAGTLTLPDAGGGGNGGGAAAGRGGECANPQEVATLAPPRTTA
jgi:hypothetical protein